MGVHVYCIVPAPARPAPGLTGLDARPVHAVAAAGVTLWLSAHEERPLPDIAQVHTHDAVVRAAMTETVTPVPVRFGQWFDDEQAAAARTAAAAQHWQERLAHFAGRAEFGVRAVASAPTPARDVRALATSGRAYMEALAQRGKETAQRRALAEQIAGEICRRAEGLVADTYSDVSAHGETIVTIAHLVAWRDVEAYHSRVGDVRGARADIKFLFSGPWPPYSFVT